MLSALIEKVLEMLFVVVKKLLADFSGKLLNKINTSNNFLIWNSTNSRFKISWLHTINEKYALI